MSTKINISPVIFQFVAVIICFISFLYPLFSFHILIFDPPSIPLPTPVTYSLTLFGRTAGNLEALAELQGQSNQIPLLTIPGIIIGIVIIIIIIFLIISSILVIINKWKIEKTKYCWAIFGILIIVSAIILIVLWTLIGDYLLNSLGADDAFWGDAAQIDLGLILLFVSGSFPIIGYVSVKIIEINNNRGK